MNRNSSWVSVTKALLGLSEDERLAIADKPERLKKFAGDLYAEVVANTYAVAISDEEAVHWLIQNKKYAEDLARGIVAKWRRTANNHYGYDGPIAWKVRAGFSLTQHAPLAGPCFMNLGYMQGKSWEMKNHEETKESLVFWIPCLAEASGHKNIKEMKEHLRTLRRRYKFPHNHCQSFGSIALLFALIFANFKRAKGRAALHDCYVVSDTVLLDGSHLSAGIFGESGLHCDPWNEEWRNAAFKFFLIGEEFPAK